MNMRAQKILKKLEADACEPQLAHALAAHIADPSALDPRIDVVGAAHQSGWLRNRIKPFLRDFASHNAEWMERCLSRILRSEWDDLAIRALLFSNARALLEILHLRSFSPIYAAQSARREGELHIIGFAFERKYDRIFLHYLQIGWSPSTIEVQKVDYAKSMFVTHRSFQSIGGHVEDGFVGGECLLGRYSTAHLPYGFWYSLEDKQTFHSASESRAALGGLPIWPQRAHPDERV